MPTSLGCIPATPTTVLSGATVGVNVGTMTGSALYSAITSAVDKVCQVPANTGAAVGSFTCDEAATATVASNVRYKSGENFEDDGILTLQMKEGSYDSLEWYETSKAVIAAFAQNSTQSEIVLLAYMIQADFQQITAKMSPQSPQSLPTRLVTSLETVGARREGVVSMIKLPTLSAKSARIFSSLKPTHLPKVLRGSCRSTWHFLRELTETLFVNSSRTSWNSSS